MTPHIFTGAGWHRFRPPSEPTIGWYQDANGWVDIFETEEEAKGGKRPIFCCSPAWFDDIATGRSRRARHERRCMEADAARLDQRGAVHTNVASPGTYLVEWREPGYPTPDGRPWTWWVEAGRRGHGGKNGLRAIAGRARRSR